MPWRLVFAFRGLTQCPTSHRLPHASSICSLYSVYLTRPFAYLSLQLSITLDLIAATRPLVRWYSLSLACRESCVEFLSLVELETICCTSGVYYMIHIVCTVQCVSPVYTRWSDFMDSSVRSLVQPLRAGVYLSFHLSTYHDKPDKCTVTHSIGLNFEDLQAVWHDILLDGALRTILLSGFPI